jgi:hypothetical protein
MVRQRLSGWAFADMLIQFALDIGQPLIDRTTNLVALQESIEGFYAHWINQKLGALSSTAGVQTPVAAVART